MWFGGYTCSRSAIRAPEKQKSSIPSGYTKNNNSLKSYMAYIFQSIAMGVSDLKGSGGF